MAKADYTRDYYADLELSSAADVADIKKQFRKLALKYHPDRNPGKEAEVNAKFQTIQAAHEILTSPEQKQKYDTQRARTSSRYPTASGVRGNPWSSYGDQFPPPPRRPGQAPTSAARNTPSSSSTRPAASSSSARYPGFNPPPPTKTSQEDMASRYTAWQKMRPKPAGQSASAAYAANANASASPSTGANTRKKASAATGASSSMPPPPPPRTASQRQKAGASFGTRRNTGFVPSSPMGDEPPAASSSNYFTQRTQRSHPTRVAEQPEPPRTPAASSRQSRESRESQESRSGHASRNGSDESLFDGRQRTPYQTHGGEKFSLFDTVPVSDLHRAKSQRTTKEQARPEPRRRSSSLPDETDTATKAPSSPKKQASSGREEAAGASYNGGASAANTSAPRASNRTRPGAAQRASYSASSSTMPQFEEQYQKMQSEHEQQQQQQQQQQQDPFTTPGAKQARKPVPSDQSNNKGKSNILYGTLPKQPPHQGTPKPAPRQAPTSNPSHFYPTHEFWQSRPGSEMAQRHPGISPHGSDQFLGHCMEPPHFEMDPSTPDPSKMAKEGIYVQKTRDRMYSIPLTREVLKNRFSDIYQTPRQYATGPMYSKRRAITSPLASEPPSGGTCFTNATSSGRQLKTPRRNMNEFEVKQFEVLEGLVRSAGVFQPVKRDEAGPAGPARQTGQSGHAGTAANPSKQEQKQPRPAKQHTSPKAPPFTRHWKVVNSGHLSSAGLSLNDDVFSSPTSPVDQKKNNVFTSISVEDINTRFVSDDNAKSTWQFSAGASEAEPGREQQRIHRTQSGNRLGRRSPGKPHPTTRPDLGQAPPPRPAESTADGSTSSGSGSSVDGGGPTKRPSIFNMGGMGGNSQHGGNTTTTTDYFDPQRWTEQFGSEHFTPGPMNQGPSAPPCFPTPNQQAPRPIKKPKPVSRTNTNTNTGTQPPPAPTYIVVEDDSDESNGEADGGGMASPVAMDIDSPPTGQPGSGGNIFGARPSDTEAGVRNIPVEPTRPEWRAGHVDNNPATPTPMNPFTAASKVSAMAAAAAAAAAAESTNSTDSTNGNAGAAEGKAGPADASVTPPPPPPPPPPPAMGSEDSEEFQATMADIRKVEPFAENVSGIQGKAGMGLGSFGDLKSHLPFESKAATPLTATGGAAGSTPRPRRVKEISFPQPPQAPHPPPALAVPGLRPSDAAWDKYLSSFRGYILAWAQFNRQYTDHCVARQEDFEHGARQPKAAGSGHTTVSGDWIRDGSNAGLDEYLEWLEQDEHVRIQWERASAQHRENVRQFGRYRDQMRQVQA